MRSERVVLISDGAVGHLHRAADLGGADALDGGSDGGEAVGAVVVGEGGAAGGVAVGDGGGGGGVRVVVVAGVGGDVHQIGEHVFHVVGVELVLRVFIRIATPIIYGGVWCAFCNHKHTHTYTHHY